MTPKVGEKYWLGCGPYEVLSEVAKVAENGAVFVYPHTLTQGINVRWRGLEDRKVQITEYAGIEKPTDDMTWGGSAHWPQLKPEGAPKVKRTVKRGNL